MTLPSRAPVLAVFLLLALCSAPLASAALFAGASKITLEHADEGHIRVTAGHDYDDWVRRFALTIDFSRIGVYEMSRAATDGVDAYFGTGEEYREVIGTLTITLDNQDGPSSLDCDLNLSETKSATATLVEYEGSMIVLAGNGLLDSDAWDCQYGGNEVVHGGAADVPLSSYAFAGVEGRDAGRFPAELAVMLGFADDEDDWSDEYSETDHAQSIVRSGYVEAEPTQGKQSHPFARQFDSEEAGGNVAYLACGSFGVTETPATSFACSIEGEATVTVTTGSTGAKAPSAPGSPTSSSPSSATSAGAAPGSGDGDASEAAGSDTPGAPLALLVLALAALALAMRRRA